MALPAVTWSFTTGTAIDSGQVNTNFSDLIASLTDGSKSLTIDALTMGGALVANGDVTLGNATADSLVVNALVNSDLVPEASTGDYDLGSTTNQWSILYMKNNIATTTAPTANAFYPNIIPKAWGMLTIGAGSSVTVTAGFNVDTATWSTTDLTINFHTDLASANFAFIGTHIPTGSNFYMTRAGTKAVGSAVINLQSGSGSDKSWVTGDVLDFVIFGTQ